MRVWTRPICGSKGHRRTSAVVLLIVAYLLYSTPLEEAGIRRVLFDIGRISLLRRIWVLLRLVGRVLRRFRIVSARSFGGSIGWRNRRHVVAHRALQVRYSFGSPGPARAAAHRLLR